MLSFIVEISLLKLLHNSFVQHPLMCYSRSINSVNNSNFGLLIAYVIPGYVAMLGLAYRADWMRSLLGQAESETVTLAGVLLLTVFSVFTGLFASTVRWLLVDTAHHRLGVHHVQWDFKAIENRVDGFQLLLESHYRYYQFYGNSLIAMPIFFVLRWSASGFRLFEFFGLVLIQCLFWIASRDSLKKYYNRTESLLNNRDSV